MNFKKASILSFFLISAFLIYPKQKAKARFYDEFNKPLPQFEYIYDELLKYYKESVPKKITVKYHDLNESYYNVLDNSVLIDPSSALKNLGPVIAHESSHICLSYFTNRASMYMQFRFYDEGFAIILENIIAKKIDDYKKEAHLTSAYKYMFDKVSFDKIQYWRAYFGDPSATMDYSAYRVGSSFDFYIIDTYGMDRLFEFFKNTGVTFDLNQSFLNIFKKDMKTIENEWFDYLKKNLPPGKEKIESENPKIIKMFPENNSKNVDKSIKEIYVEFNMPMERDFCIFTDCLYGICYKDGYWKNNRIFAVKVNLLSDRKYILPLGSKDKNCFISKSSLKLFPVLWMFDTGK